MLSSSSKSKEPKVLALLPFVSKRKPNYEDEDFGML